jgi:hypothetical protein
MNITFNAIFIFLMFWLSANFGNAGFYRSLKEKSNKCSITNDKKGGAVIKLSKLILVIQFVLIFLPAMIYGGLALIFQEFVFSFSNKIFDTSLATALNSDNEYLIVLIYGFIVCCGYYIGKSSTANFAAEVILDYASEITPADKYMGNRRLQVFQKILKNKAGN